MIYKFPQLDGVIALINYELHRGDKIYLREVTGVKNAPKEVRVEGVFVGKDNKFPYQNYVDVFYVYIK